LFLKNNFFLSLVQVTRIFIRIVISFYATNHVVGNKMTCYNQNKNKKININKSVQFLPNEYIF
jgi:hypothetical protein